MGMKRQSAEGNSLGSGASLRLADLGLRFQQEGAARRAHDGEKLTTLDGEERELRPNNMLVTDPSGALSLAGVMGVRRAADVAHRGGPAGRRGRPVDGFELLSGTRSPRISWASRAVSCSGSSQRSEFGKLYAGLSSL